MADRDIDVVVQSVGQNPFSPQFGEAEVDTSFYRQALAGRRLTRTLVNLRAGTTNAIGDAVAGIVAELLKRTGGDLGRIGALCLYGDSNGSGQTLSLAKELAGRGAPRPGYVGVADLTLFPGGRQPPVPGIGDLTPINPPDVSLWSKTIGIVSAKNLLPPFVGEQVPPPRITEPGIAADLLENYYTHQGNRMRLQSNSPAGPNRYWWSSTMNGGEVHGEIAGGGWVNNRRMTMESGSTLVRGPPSSIDDNHHGQLCGLATREMNVQAGNALAAFIRKTVPS